jgi:type 1 glutamine amidotransferase
MIRLLLSVLLAGSLALSSAYGQKAPFHVLAFYSTNVEADHVLFANQAIDFFTATAKERGFDFKATTNWDELKPETLSHYQLVLWLNEFPHTEAQRTAFEHYMSHGGGWLGFHVSAYNDADTHWPWFVDFLGGGVFFGNNWPPLPAKLIVDNRTSPITKGLPATFTAPANEWYSWKPDPRSNASVKVLLTLDPANYPLGLKDMLTGGDVPVVWTNTKYKMIYMNMGHGDKIFTDPTQNQLFVNALEWFRR